MTGTVWIGLAWVLFVVVVAMLIVRRRRHSSRHFPYEARAALLQDALANKLIVRVVYWSQVEGRWLRRKLEPVSLSAGHLRATDLKTGKSRRFEVTRMRKVAVNGRTVRPPLRWHVPFAALLGALAAAVSVAAVRDRIHTQRTNSPTVWEPSSDWQEMTPLQTTGASTATATIQAEPTVAAPRPLPWSVVVENDQQNSFTAVVAAFEQVFLYARPQAIYAVRMVELGERAVVWQGSYDVATNYVAELQKRGLKSVALQTGGESLRRAVD